MKYERINFENGQLVSPGSVDLETGELIMPVYTGETPINDVNLNKMDEAIEYLFENGVGSSIPQLTVPMVSPKLIPIPPYNEQVRICNRIKQIFDSIKDEV